METLHTVIKAATEIMTLQAVAAVEQPQLVATIPVQLAVPAVQLQRAAPAHAALLGGQVQAMFHNPVMAVPAVQVPMSALLLQGQRFTKVQAVAADQRRAAQVDRQLAVLAAVQVATQPAQGLIQRQAVAADLIVRHLKPVAQAVQELFT